MKIELQSTKDDSMGFRMFVYSLNVAEKEDETYKFPKGITIYTTLDKEKRGMDVVNMQLEHFSVGETKYSAENGDFLTVEFPFINLLTMEFQEFQHSPFEPLKIIYPYKYRKKPELMKNKDEFQDVMETVRMYTLGQVGSDKLVVSGLVSEIVVDLLEICKKSADKFSEELEIMEYLNKTSTQIYGDQCKAEGEARSKLAIAKNLLDILDNGMIALKTGLPLEQIEQLRANS